MGKSVAALRLFIVLIRHGKRHAVYAAHARDEADAAQIVLGKNTGWTAERVLPKEDRATFRLYDSAWEFVEEDFHTRPG